LRELSQPKSAENGWATDAACRTATQQAKELAAIFGSEDMRKIDRENALKLVPRWRQA
jgi:hypothetical protein